ncbi:CPBP family intramembrane glutamic endopeptidase [Staphylococcus xylosus]|uniref:CPBP family intramembrane glutamic endopeptidase n=1 Tax=Staphylococcus xylosus TaxID=1288 RepID=UPI001CDBDCB3|nr:type II CAAX endopeptidase family protein [Staphylococcus xylosus]MCA2503997.1 CPBP family intramembrane metalloprotease [Staphylococcus xylosus]MCQ3820666.1 CPBP family intramembrane metalloprotease [Staphylococcus xylosus]
MRLGNNYHSYWTDITKRDFILPIVYLILNTSTSFFTNSSIYSSILELVNIVLILILWSLLHKSNFNYQINRGINSLIQNKKLVILTFLCVLILKTLYSWLVNNFIPIRFQYNQTQNDAAINELLNNNFLTLLLVFVTSVIGAPIIEEFFFRHLLIGELGKKFNYYIMAFVSLFVFAILHVTFANSPFEIGPYLIVSFSLVYIYLKTNHSLSSAIALHILNNIHGFCLLIFFN